MAKAQRLKVGERVTIAEAMMVSACFIFFLVLLVGGERIVYFCGIVNKFFTLFRFFLRELCGTS